MECSWPDRMLPPEIPVSLQSKLKKENAEQRMLQNYASSAFKICKHKKFQLIMRLAHK